MADQRRPRPPRRFVRRANSAHNPLDEFTGIPTDPKYLVTQDGIKKDGRRGVGSYDEPPYKGVLTDPVTED